METKRKGSINFVVEQRDIRRSIAALYTIKGEIEENSENRDAENGKLIRVNDKLKELYLTLEGSVPNDDDGLEPFEDVVKAHSEQLKALGINMEFLVSMPVIAQLDLIKKAVDLGVETNEHRIGGNNAIQEEQGLILNFIDRRIIKQDDAATDAMASAITAEVGELQFTESGFLPEELLNSLNIFESGDEAARENPVVAGRGKGKSA